MARWWAAAAIAILSSSTSAFAADDWTEWGLHIDILSIRSDGIVLLLDQDPAATSSTCPNKFLLLSSASNFDLFASAIMTAYARGDEIRILSDVDNTVCSTAILQINVRSSS